MRTELWKWNQAKIKNLLTFHEKNQPRFNMTIQ